MALRSLYLIDNESLTVTSSTSQSVGDAVINNSDSPNGTQYVFGSGWATQQVTLNDTGGSADTLEDDNSANHLITDGSGLVANGNAVEAESLIQLRELDANGVPTGPVITIVVFSQNGTTSDVWGYASDTPLIAGVEYEKVGGSNTGTADYADYTSSWSIIVDGTDGGDVMGAGFVDVDGDQIDGTDGIDDIIFGYAGSDTISGGAGADTIYGDYDGVTTAPAMPDFISTDAAAGPASGAEVSIRTLTNATINNKGQAKITIDKFATKGNANDVTINDGGTEALLKLVIEKGGDNDGQADVFRLDLSTFNDDFTIELKNTDSLDKLVLTNVHTATDNGDGTYDVTYYGSDSQLHTISGIKMDNASLEAHVGPSSPYFYDDVIDGGAGDDLIDGGLGDDNILGGLGNDSIDGGVGDDTIDGGADNDTILGNDGNDSLTGGTGLDSLDGGMGDDTVLGGAGNDTLYGGDGAAATPLERTAFKWSDIPDPTDGGQIDNNDALVNGTQTVNGVDVGYTFSTANATYGTETIATSGIDAGTGTVNPNSAISFDNAVTVDLNFGQPVENLQFRINDFEGDLEGFTLKAYDASGNLIPFTVSPGANMTGSNTDAVAGNDTFSSSAGEQGDTGLSNSVLFTVQGPVARIEMVMTSPGNGSLTGTDIYFDDPATGPGLGGNDSLDGGDGNDVIIAGLGNDTIAGGAGTDTYDANTSANLANETITVTIDQTGSGTSVKTNDATTDTLSSLERIIAAEAAAEADAITINGNVLRGDISGVSDNAVGIFTPGSGAPIAFGGAGQPTINDILSGTYDPGTGIVRPKGHYEITSGEEDGAQLGEFYVENFEAINFDVICFTRGTRITTDRGDIAIESLRAGDLVETLDHGLQPIGWIGSSTVAAHGRLAPISIAAGALGNDRDLLVSPQHRMLVGGWQVELCFGQPDVLTTAKSLVNGDTIRRKPGGNVEYFHMLFDRHQIVFAEGAPSESFHPGTVGMATLSDAARRAVFAKYPDLETGNTGDWETARTCLRSFEAAVLDSTNLGTMGTDAKPLPFALAA